MVNALQGLRATEYFFLNRPDPVVFNSPKSRDKRERETSPSQNIICRVCLAEVTTKRDQFTKNSREEHCFFNPHGIAFVVKCFKKAHGCTVIGDPSPEFSWFEGYLWNFALCTGCGEHLGWFFQNYEGSSFFGLIPSKLIEAA